jgi:glyoxylase I family protein
MPQSPKNFKAINWTLTVSDLERSTRFYCDGLGFAQGKSAERGDEVAPIMELPSCKVKIRYLDRSDTRLQLVEFLEPAVIGSGERKPSNQLGPHMLAFACDDPKSVAADLVQLGGEQVLNAKASGGRFDMYVVTDPDGFRIELVSAPIEAFEPLFGR